MRVSGAAMRRSLLCLLLPLGLATEAQPAEPTAGGASNGFLWAIAEEGQACDQVCAQGCVELGGTSVASIVDTAFAGLEAVDLQCRAFSVQGLKSDGTSAAQLVELGHGSLEAIRDAVAALVNASSRSGLESRYSLNVNRHQVCALREQLVATPLCKVVTAGGTASVCACARFDCHSGDGNVRAAWSASKKHWCCDVETVGCAETDVNWVAVQDDPFDCHVGRGDWGEIWESGANKWCCDKEGSGCLEISKVSGARARYASGNMDLVVGRPQLFASDPLVTSRLEKGIADVIGVDPRTVSVRLQVANSSQASSVKGTLRGSGEMQKLVLLEYTVAVPMDSTGHLAVDSSGLGDAMVLAAMSASEWTRVLEGAMGQDGGYVFSVAFVGEVALSNVSPLPLKMHGVGEGIFELILGAVIVLMLVAGLSVYLAPRLGQEPSARIPDLSPKKRLMHQDSIADFMSESTTSPCKREDKSPSRLPREESRSRIELDDEQDDHQSEVSQSTRKEEQQKKCCFVGGGKSCRGSPCGSGGVCGSSKGASEPAIAGGGRR